MPDQHHDNIELTAGDDWSIDGKLYADDGVTLLDLSNSTLTWTLISPDGCALAGNGVTIAALTPPDAGGNNISVTVPASFTAPLRAGRYFDALKILGTDNKQSLLWVGPLLIDPNPFGVPSCPTT